MTRKPYPTDLTDLQWDNVEHLVEGPKPGGRPRKYSTASWSTPSSKDRLKLGMKLVTV
jgi:hypothetical protein